MFKQIKQIIQQYQLIYFDYFLINSLISLVIFKINKITFQISFIYLFIGILLFVIIFKNYLLLIGNKIKDTYFFNFILFSDLLIKEFIYSCIFTFIESMTFDKSKKLYIFLFFFSFSYFITTFLFYVGMHYNLIFFIFLLLISILNLIENQYIFTQKNIDENQLENLNFKNIQTILNIKNTKFNKNQNLFYIQKRYMHYETLRKFAKEHALTVLTSATAGTLFLATPQYLQSRTLEKRFECEQRNQNETNAFLERNFLFKKYKERLKESQDLSNNINALNLQKAEKLDLKASRSFWSKYLWPEVYANLIKIYLKLFPMKMKK